MTGGSAPWWPVGIAAIIRLGLWLVLPPRFASDEDSYYQVATQLLANGERDLASSAAGPSLNLGNGYFGHVPEPLADHLRLSADDRC